MENGRWITSAEFASLEPRNVFLDSLRERILIAVSTEIGISFSDGNSPLN